MLQKRFYAIALCLDLALKSDTVRMTRTEVLRAWRLLPLKDRERLHIWTVSATPWRPTATFLAQKRPTLTRKRKGKQ